MLSYFIQILLYDQNLTKQKFDNNTQILLEMFSTKKLLSLGFLFAGVIGSQYKNPKHVHNQNCDEQDMIEVLAILDDENPLCSKWSDDQCLQCASKSYFNEKGICVQIDPLCKNFDSKQRKCLNCYGGYQLSNGKCVVEKKQQQPNWTLDNPLCAIWEKKRCTKCSPKSFFNADGTCVMVSPDCKSHSEATGYCLSCFDGYELDKNGKCNKLSDDYWKSRDPLCSKWTQKGACLQCAPRSYKNKSGVCQLADPHCYTFSLETGQCQSCYKGYALKNGKCIEDTNSVTSSNPYCAKWQDSRCLKCSSRTFMNKGGVCTPINPQCRTYSQENGYCTTCYPGFKIDAGKCVDAPVVNTNSNPLCSTWSGIECVRCSPRSYFGAGGLCIAVDANCRDYQTNNGDCVTCYDGFQVVGGRCVVKNVGPSQQDLRNNLLCNQWKDGKCSACSQRSYFNEKGICTEIDPYCQKFSEEKKICQKCYPGYKLKKDLSGCVAPGISKPSLPVVDQPNPQKGYDDPLCASWQNAKKCRSCAPGAYLCETGKCQAFDSNCKKFNHNEKICQECQNGLEAVGDRCIKFELNSKFDLQKCVVWKNGSCDQCARGLTLNSTGVCTCK